MNWIHKQIKQAGAKLTSVRSDVATLIEKKGLCTFRTQNIIDALPNLDRVSVYRTIELLEQLDVIHPTVVIGGSQYYEIHQHNKHHHHSFCQDCGESECTPCPISGNQTNHHTLFYTSNDCAHCT